MCTFEENPGRERSVYEGCVRGCMRGIQTHTNHDHKRPSLKTNLHPFSETTSVLANYHCNDRGSSDGERSMPGLQEAAD